MRHAKFALQLDPLRRHQCGEGRAQFTARGKLVIGAATKRLRRIIAAQQPDRFSRRRLFREPREIGEGADRRMARA